MGGKAGTGGGMVGRRPDVSAGKAEEVPAAGTSTRALARFEDVFWTPGLRNTVCASVFAERIVWSGMAEPQFHDETEFEAVQSIGAFLCDGSPSFASSDIEQQIRAWLDEHGLAKDEAG